MNLQSYEIFHKNGNLCKITGNELHSFMYTFIIFFRFFFALLEGFLLALLEGIYPSENNTLLVTCIHYVIQFVPGALCAPALQKLRLRGRGGFNAERHPAPEQNGLAWLRIIFWRHDAIGNPY